MMKSFTPFSVKIWTTRNTLLWLLFALTTSKDVPAQESQCSICPYPAPAESSIPPPWITIMPRPPSDFFLQDDPYLKELFSPFQNTQSCQQWDRKVASRFANSSSQCLDLRDYLQDRCCFLDPNEKPLYQCRADAYDAVLNDSYKAHLAPIRRSRAQVVVGVQLRLSRVQVVDHGVAGGTIYAVGSLSLDWQDERLQFQEIATEDGCWSFPVPNTDEIWTPDLAPITDEEEVDSPLVHLPGSTTTVLADGHVYWNQHGNTVLQCATVDGSSKECEVTWYDNTVRGDIRYEPRGVVVALVEDLSTMIPGYRINQTTTTVRLVQHPDDLPNLGTQQVQLLVRLDPLETDCNICGDDNSTTLVGNTTVTSRLWLDQFPHTKGWNCQQLDEYLTTLTVADPTCMTGRAFLEEICCDDTRSTFECESNIHDSLADLTNTITPPDPSPREDDPFVSSEDMIDVTVSLDVSHVFGIEVKDNTMAMLVSLELEWYDNRLTWDPFLGGCHRASFRASLDAELTEIWVPQIELVNMELGVNTLPESHASVMHTGKVIWRRTGVLEATCELEGIQHFPFDTSGCYLEFGGTRSPLFHRVNYIQRGVEYSSRVSDKSWNFQEYKLDITRTNVTQRIEELSGFTNQLIRYQFYFDRAKGYYVTMFIVLYVCFTFLSFGMFFVDLRLGERIGYGSSILFVIVAQDITLAEFTPVTQEKLWIYNLSLGSKIFVILGIVQSIGLLYIFSQHLLEDQDLENNAKETQNEETLPFLKIRAKPTRGEKQGDLEQLDETKTTAPVVEDLATGQQGERKGKPGFSRQRTVERAKSVLKDKLGVPDKKNDPEKLVTMKKLWLIDKITAMGFVVAYVIFLIVLFADVPL